MFFTKSEREILEPLTTTGGHSKLVTRSRSVRLVGPSLHLSSQLGCFSLYLFLLPSLPLLFTRFSICLLRKSNFFSIREKREILLLVVESSGRKRLRIRNDKGNRIRRIEQAGSSNAPLKPSSPFRKVRGLSSFRDSSLEAS